MFGVKVLRRQLDDLPRLQVQLEDVRPGRRRVPLAAVAQVVEVRVKDPLAVEADHRIGDRAVAAFDQHFLAAVGVQQHQVGPRLHRHRLRKIGVEPLVDLVAGPVGPDIDDVVVVVDRLVALDVRNDDVDRRFEELLFGIGSEGGQRQAAGEQAENQALHRLFPAEASGGTKPPHSRKASAAEQLQAADGDFTGGDSAFRACTVSAISEQSTRMNKAAAMATSTSRDCCIAKRAAPERNRNEEGNYH